MEARGGKRETEAELRKQTAPQTCLSLLLFCAGPCQAGLAEGEALGATFASESFSILKWEPSGTSQGMSA